MFSTIVMVMHIERGRHSFWMIQAFPKPKHDWAQRNETTPIFSPHCYGISFVLPGPSGFDSLIILLYSMALWSPETLLGSAGYQLCHRCCHPGCGWIPPAHKNLLWACRVLPSRVSTKMIRTEHISLDAWFEPPASPKDLLYRPCACLIDHGLCVDVEGVQAHPSPASSLDHIATDWKNNELHAKNNSCTPLNTLWFSLPCLAVSCCCFHVKCKVFVWCPGTDRLDFPVQV